MTALDVFGLILFGALVIGFFKLILGIKTVPAPTQGQPASKPQQKASRGDRREPRRSEPPSVPTSSTTADECWVRPGQATAVAGRAIASGMFYVGRGLTSVIGRGIEPALVDPMLTASRTGEAHKAAALSYWPSYSSISRECRGAYLNWLASGRRTSADIGYVFLYFYGLERRVFAEAVKSDSAATDLDSIQQEVEQLLRLHGTNRSFDRYANQLLDVIAALNVVQSRTTQVCAESPIAIRAAIGRSVSEGKPIPADLAMAWFLSDPETPSRIPLERCRPEFERLFVERFQKRFGAGIQVSASSSRLLQVSLRPASASFGGEVRLTFDVPDINALTSAVKKLRELGETCTADLDAFSRWVGRNPGAQKTVAALALLPAELARSQDDSEARGLWRWLDTQLGSNSRSACSADDLLQHCPSFGAGKLAKSEGVVLAQLLEKHGVGIEPDVRFGGAPVAPGGQVILFQRPPNSPSVASPQYAAATILLHLAVNVAAADGSISAAEESRLEEHIEKALGLNHGETVRLSAHVHWLRTSPPSLAGLKRRLAALTTQQRTSIADFLVGVAGADGQISPEEIRTLGKVYPLLGLPEEDVFGHVHAMTVDASSATHSDEPIVIAERQPTTSYVIPSRPEPTRNIRLNMAAVQTKLDESAKLAAILQDVFSEDEPQPYAPVAPAPSSAASAKIPQGHIMLLHKLAERPQWTRGEFDEAAEGLGLMPDGAIDTVNEAGFEHLGVPILEGDDPIDVNIAAAKELLS